MKPTIALCIMVKDEEKTLPRLLASVQGFADIVIALDTGSTDGTLDILRAQQALILQEPFIDFGQSRTRLMEFAKGKADWLLLLDADMALHFDPATLRISLPLMLDPGVTCYSLEHCGGYTYWVPRIVRGDLDWVFKGSTHEYLERTENPVRLDGVKVKHYNDGGSRSDKLVRDRRLLTAELAADPTNTRALFYLANTERDSNFVNAARELYLQRARLPGWPEETFYAAFEAARISQNTAELLQCSTMRPSRAEPLAILADVYRGQGKEEMAERIDSWRLKLDIPKEDILFVDASAYGPRVPLAIQLWHSVPGWFSDEDALCYKSIVDYMPMEGGRFVEIGSYCGRSMACFDHLRKLAGKSIDATAVDIFEETPGDHHILSNFYRGGYLSEFEANMKRCGCDPTVMALDSVSAARTFKPGSLDAVFIDAEHTEEAVIADINAWLPKVKPGGIIAGHDYDWAAVKAGVLKFFNPAEITTEGHCWSVSLGPVQS